MAEPNRDDPNPIDRPDPEAGECYSDQTQPAEEWGERIATSKAIARGGKSAGDVPGATDQSR